MTQFTTSPKSQRAWRPAQLQSERRGEERRGSLSYFSIPAFTSASSIHFGARRTSRANQRIRPNDTTLTHLYTQSAKATGSPADLMVVVAGLYSLGPFCNQVGTMWIPSVYHLFKAGRGPVAANLAMRKGNKLHHLLNMHLLLYLLKAHD